MEEVKVSVGTRIKSFFVQCNRVWHILRKPSKEEFLAVAKVSSIGILIIGAVGFLVSDFIKIVF